MILTRAPANDSNNCCCAIPDRLVTRCQELGAALLVILVANRVFGCTSPMTLSRRTELRKSYDQISFLVGSAVLYIATDGW